MQQQMLKIIAYGRVQGVGFRPSVCKLARQLALQGFVRNSGGCVEIVVAGEKAICASFLQKLQKLPEPAVIENLTVKEIGLEQFAEVYDTFKLGHEDSFFAVESTGVAFMPVAPADIAICPQCQQEVKNPKNRRFGYPYISCAQCGPRYTIMERLPYDRVNTTMKSYELCPECQQEYVDMGARRGHAETISCSCCGPQLQAYIRDKDEYVANSKKAVAMAKELLKAGKIIMVKAIGGFNLVCRADSKEVVAALRSLKRRPSKPFAIMVASIAAAKAYCEINEKEVEMLEGAVRPIVLLPKKQGIAIADNVAGGCAELGVFLPSMGLYQQLCELEIPLIVTSCNFTGSPIIFRDKDAICFYEQQEQVAGLFTYERDILRPADDSVVRVLHKGKKDTVQVLRRTKGYMPEPINLKTAGILKDSSKILKTEREELQMLGVGAQMEPSFGFSIGNRIYPGQLPGDVENESTELQWLTTLEDWQALLQLSPQFVVGDLHPDYATTNLGREFAEKRNLRFLQIQHHQAHALAVMAEHKLEDEVLAVCFDGTGYGTDGTVWGGEFLLCKGSKFERVAHLQAIPMLGGDASMQQAWKSALCYLAELEQQRLDVNVEKMGESLDTRYKIVKAALKGGVNVIHNSSMGRLFDAAAAILGLADFNSHSGRCAQVLEEQATLALNNACVPLPMHFTKVNNCWSCEDILLKLLEAKKAQDVHTLQSAALGFHKAVIDMVVATSKEVSLAKGIKKVVLGGGCFANRILLEGCVERLQELKFEVYFNEKVAPGDGGIALGQAYYGIIVKNKN